MSDPPLIVPIEGSLTPDQAATFLERYHELLRTYRRSLLGDRRYLLEEFRFVHMAHKVVGVGSVGTRAWIILCSVAITAIRCSSRPRRLRIRCSLPSSARADSRIRVSGWWRGSG